jgi:hypothetical protein
MWLIWSGIAAAAMTFAGCTQPRYEYRIVGQAYAIFNPSSSELLVNNARPDWPATQSGQSTTEEFAYHEHIVDVHGRGMGQSDGYLYRRFESDRFGRGRR